MGAVHVIVAVVLLVDTLALPMTGASVTVYGVTVLELDE